MLAVNDFIGLFTFHSKVGISSTPIIKSALAYGKLG